MAFIQCDFYSDALGISSSMYVILPQNAQSQIGMSSKAEQTKHKTLFLLHGLSDDHTIWLRRTSIERYAAPLGLAVVMPAANRSFYSNMVGGADYWTFISEELPALARSFFPLSDRPEDNFVAGLSMGGYGAFKLALNKPDQFAAAASLSGALDVSTLDWRMPEDFKRIYGTKELAMQLPNNLFLAAQELKDSGKPMPSLFQVCGTEDFLYEDNVNFRKHAEELGLPLTYMEGPGDHSWEYWDEHIQQVLKWLPLGR
ncbi:alpha/beta hydrolase [Paenibacillus sacheonensis]|uniref:Esterase family protein n=1 Tax=Paenibacillus sacheonensis TaxID=742054 RepID=A0A7X5BX96_9BACL|nr:alpha/beta hydrolase family protein [Paenibacillus sacheonensis]MBM7563296.1 S-formylglutathione hydrolase FrmB [Paenibacillus sacheonensis]NBC68146.1 esterase family protein [Paenibacillus sacheonensis]